MLVGVLAVGVAVAGCGSGGGGKGEGVASVGGNGGATSTTRAGASSDLTQAALAYGRCMRQHGINVPDPQVTAKGIRQHPPTDMDRDDPRLGAAEQACHQYGRLPSGQPGQ